MPNLIPGQVINLPDDQLNLLAKHLENEITNLENVHADYFKRIAIWWRWYEAEPRLQKKNFPFLNASNIVIPIIQIMSDGLIARSYNSVFGAGDNVWTARTENEDNQGMARDVVRYLNWQAKGNDYDLRLAIYDCFSELYPIGSSVLALNWREGRQYMYSPGVRGGKFSRSVARPVRYAHGPVVEHSPRENYLWDVNYGIGEAPIVVRELSYTWTTLKRIAQMQPRAWHKENIEAIRTEHGQEGPSKVVRDEKNRMDDMQEARPEDYTKPHDIREVHVDWPVVAAAGLTRRAMEDIGTPDIPLVATLHRKTGRILQLKAEPYNLPYKPFFDFFFRKRSGRGHAVGVAKRLKNMQSMMTTQFNQSIDAVTRANSVWAVTSNKKHMEQPLDPSHPIWAPGMEKEFKAFDLSKGIGPDHALIQAGQMIAERQMGIFDPAFGRESRSGGHPSPATSTLAMLENTDVMAAPTMSMLRRQIGRLGEAIAVLNQQFETNEDGKIHRVLGGIDGDQVSKFLFPQEPIPGNYQFDVVALSPQNNPDSEMNRAVQVGQMNQLYWGQIIQGVQAMESQQVGPGVKQAWMKYIESMTNTYMRFLESANVDEIEKYVINLRAAQQGQAPGNMGVAPGVGGVAGAPTGVAQQLPVGLPPRPIASGTPLSFGQTG